VDGIAGCAWLQQHLKLALHLLGDLSVRCVQIPSETVLVLRLGNSGIKLDCTQRALLDTIETCLHHRALRFQHLLVHTFQHVVQLAVLPETLRRVAIG
jgi:hypothetical protein